MALGVGRCRAWPNPNPNPNPNLNPILTLTLTVENSRLVHDAVASPTNTHGSWSQLQVGTKDCDLT